MEELYNIIGKLYVDIYNAQRYIESLQGALKDKDKIIADLKLDMKKANVDQQ
jgi:hypothetical protein